jgi:hypothetical protein
MVPKFPVTVVHHCACTPLLLSYEGTTPSLQGWYRVVCEEYMHSMHGQKLELRVTQSVPPLHSARVLSI